MHSEKDSLNFLIEAQKDTDRPIYIVPQLILYKKNPEKDRSGLLDILFGFKDKPGYIRKIVLFFRHHRRAFIDFGSPLNLKSYLEAQPEGRSLEDMASEIRQMMIDRIDGQKRVILGPVMKSRQQLKEKVLKDPDIARAIEQIGSGNTKQLRQAKKKAGEFFDEIAADYNITYILILHKLVTWLWKKIFQGIDVDLQGLAVLREQARRGPIIYVPSHKSHIDYLIINCVLYDNHMHIPRIAAGKNLSFWPMGHVFRKAGAFFIRRSFKGEKLYSKVFTKYIKALLEEGHPLQFFIEGGRSRSGKLVLPKTGFLSILLQSYEEGACKDLVFAPASIIYDTVLEEKSYLNELTGGEKKQENFKQVVKARRFLKKKYGKVYIRFGSPISLNEYFERETGRDEKTHRNLALHLIRSINKVSLVTPLALVSTAILSAHRKGFHIHELIETARTLHEFLERQDMPIADSLKNLEERIEETLSLLIERKVASFLEDADGVEKFYYVEEEKKRELEYYKNTVIHCFILHAFVAASLLTGSEETKSVDKIIEDYSFLKNTFKNEFVYDEEKITQAEVKLILSYFSEALYIQKCEEQKGYKLTKSGFEKLPIWAIQAKTFIESYWIVSRAYIQKEIVSKKRGDFLKHINYLGQRFHKTGLIDHIEAISQVTFSNAINYINEEILKGYRRSSELDSNQLEKLSKFSHRLYDLCHYRS